MNSQGSSDESHPATKQGEKVVRVGRDRLLETARSTPATSIFQHRMAWGLQPIVLRSDPSHFLGSLKSLVTATSAMMAWM